MSFVNDVDIYKKMVSKEIVEKSCAMDENSTEFVVLPKCEHMEETLVVGEEIVVDENMDISQQMSEEDVCKRKDEYFDDSVNSTMSVEYEEDPIALSPGNSPEHKWFSDKINKQELLYSESEESENDMSYKVVSDDQDENEEETIATFVTATGQQLALYAVEDLDEIFAVAVYDESGEPPTNFQFLMKSDVERLIGEGAVRTVKKPTQMKRQLVTTQSPVFFSKSEPNNIYFHNENKIMSNGNGRVQMKQDMLKQNSSLMEHSNLNLNTKRVPNILYTTDEKQSDLAYLMMDNCSVNMDNSAEHQEDDESDGELVEQSTVQYILFEGDQSDSELTFDEIHETLQNLKSNTTKKQPNKKIIRDQKNSGNIKGEYEAPMHQNSNLSNRKSNTLTERRLNLLDSKDRQELLEVLTDSPTDMVSSSTNLDISNGSIECTSPESSQIQYKAKRSRKQQLISVNREDSEIIIQPASLLSEEDNNIKKKARRNRRVVNHSGYRQRNNDSKRVKKAKRKEVEIIEIDVDEGESILQSQRDVVEITIDDSKDKYSSDKENEIIMVGDSDDEAQQSNSKAVLLQCQHCSRNFRQQRALETHLRVCSKSPANVMRFNEQKLKHANGTTNEEDTVKKQYPCKICQQKFDVVVALARHVRSEHSQKKKRRFSKSLVEQPSIEVKEMKEHVEPKKPLTIIKKIKKKISQRPSCTWEVKKLSCSDCGRWFPSTALLRAHCLQHETKLSEQQLRRCHVCKKIIKSRSLFLQHLKKHRSLQKNTSAISNIQKKLRTTRSVTGKITTLRKRGRSRKL